MYAIRSYYEQVLNNVAQSASLQLVLLTASGSESGFMCVNGDFANPHIETLINNNGFEPVLFVFLVEPQTHWWYRGRLAHILRNTGHLRVPYLFIGSDFDQKITEISVPVTFLNEEKEKAPWSIWMAKHFNAEVVVYQPADFGRRAQKNVRFLTEMLSNSEVLYKVAASKKRSLKIEADIARNAGPGTITVISASRTYSLDDDLFGPIV